MQHVHHLIWNDATRAWVASELASARGKRGRTVLLGAAALVMLRLPAAYAQTLPTGGSIAHGLATISQSGSNLTVTQASKNAVLNWNSFSVGNGARAHFDNGTGATLNRVTGSLPSSIDGSLTATGSLYLVNRNGVVVGANGVINAAGFMATTHDIGDEEFMAGGAQRFFGDSRAGIVNLGSIHADSGNVALVAHSVRNEGAISAPNGAAELLAGQEIFLASPDAPALLVSLGTDTASSAETGVSNTGLIEAAQARMQAARGNLYALAVNQSGIIRATGVSTREGRIVLTADGGTVRQDGKLSAHNADGSGGTILVGGDYQGSNTSVANAASTIVTGNAEMDASATQGDGGRVIVWANEDTRFAGSIQARGGENGGDGGFVEVSGKHTLDFRPRQPIDLSAKAGKTGTVLLDPDQLEVLATASGPNQVAVSTIEAGLASANYALTTANFNPLNGDGNITISDDLNWTSGHTLTLTSGAGININANITGANGTLALYGAGQGVGGEGAPPGTPIFLYGDVTLSAGNTISVDTLRFGTKGASLPDGMDSTGASNFGANGTLRVNTLELDLAGGVNVDAPNDDNAIGALRTTGSGAFQGISVVDGEGDLRVYLNSTDKGERHAVTIVTPGNLTLEAGSFLSFAGNAFARDVVLASTGGNFINEAGSTVFGDKLRYLIYSGTSAGTDRGGLTGVAEYSRTYAGNPPSDYSVEDGISRFLFVQAGASPELTYRADDFRRLYGDANPALGYSVSGLLGTDSLDDVTDGSPLLSTSATLHSGVGAYTINISKGTLSSTSYDFFFLPGTLTVDAAPLTLDIDNLSRYYGATNPALKAKVTGLKAGDTANDILAGLKLSTDATRASGVGDYEVGASRLGTSSANYLYTINPGTLTIKPTPVTLTLDPMSRPYGDANPDFRAWATLSGAYNGDSVAEAFPTSIFSTSASQGSSVGSYAVSAGGFSNPNYLLTIGSIGALTIDKANLVVNANNAGRLYGDADPAFSVASITGWRNGDTLASISDLVLASDTSGSSHVGSYAIMPSGKATNYNFVAGSGRLTIDKAPVVVRLGAATRVYGDSDPAFTATYEGLKNGETSLPGLSPFSNANLHSPVGNYLVLTGDTTFQNYLPTFYAGVLTVAPRPLTVTADNVNRSYGGADPAFSLSVGNATAWDAAQAARYWVASSSASQRSDVGDYAITASANPYGDRFDNLGNYAVTLNPGTLAITRAPVNVVANPVSIIWGDELPPITYSLNGGIMPWDNEGNVGKALLTSVAGGVKAAPGQYPIMLASSAVGKNYFAVLEGRPLVDVLRRPITITGNYSTSFAQLQQIYAGQIEPFTVKRYDSNGTLWMSPTSAPLAGGPQFSVLASSDGTRGDGLGAYVTTAFIEPAAGESMDNVLRYYDPVSKPGTALTLQGNDGLINPNVLFPPPAEIVLNIPNQGSGPLVLRDITAPGDAPSVRNLLQDAYPDADTMMQEIRDLFDIARGTGGQAYATSQLLGSVPLELRQKLLAAEANDGAWKWLQEVAADTEKKLAELAAERPRVGHYDALKAAWESNLAKTRAEMDAMPNYDSIYREVMSGDPQLVQQFVPLMTAGLLNAQKEGTLSPDTQDKLLGLINAQRAQTVAAADAKYAAIMGEDRGLAVAFSTPKIPDIVGAAYVDAAANQMALAQGLTGTAASAVSAATTAGVLVAIASQSLGGQAMGANLFNAVGIAVGSTKEIFTAGAGGAAAMAGPMIIASAALAIGIAEINQIVESTKNYERYMSFKAANVQLTSLAAFDMSKSDNVIQMITAMSAMMTESMGKHAQ